MLRSSQYEFEGSTFEVLRPRRHSAKRKEEVKTNPNVQNTVIVSYKNDTPDEEDVELWLEESDNGGGSLKQMTHDQENKRFVAVFQDPKRNKLGFETVLQWLQKLLNDYF